MIFQCLSFSRRRILAVTLASILSPAAAIADTPANTPTNLDNIVVTGVRHAQTVDDSLASVTVIDRKQIEQSPAVDLISLLAQQAGVDVARTGGAGQTSSVFLRGANSNQTLMLIDGIRVASSTNGFFDLANLPLDQIERIEIVRGPRAAFWGSDAIGGVIQIFTRNPQPFEASAEVGSYGLRGGDVSFGTPADGDSRVGMTLGDTRERGFSATNPANLFSYNPDDDGYQNRNASLRGSVPLGTQTLGFVTIHTDGNAAFDNGPTIGRDTTASTALNTSGGLTLSGPLAAHWSQSLTVGGADSAIDTPVFGTRDASQRTSVDWINTLDAIANGVFTFGGNWQRDSGTAYNVFSVNADGIDFARSTTNAAGFAGYDAKFGPQQVELAIRHDHNSQFGGATTGTAAWGWQIDPMWRARASWGQGFRAPSFDELYSPSSFGAFAGNPLLQPEHSQSLEAGLEFKPSAASAFTLSTWRTRVRDLIDFVAPDYTMEENIARADLDGTELSYRYTNGPWSAGSSITVQDPRDAQTGDLLLRRPRRKIAADVHYDFGNGWDVSVNGLAASVRQDFDTALHGYGLLDLATGWKFHPGWSAQLRLNNLFDEHYELADGYNTPGRNAQLTLTWQPFK